MTKIPNFENSRWLTAAILKIVLSLYLSRKSSDLNENLVCRCRLWFQGRLLNKILKFCKFKVADGRHIENRVLRISQRVINRINTKFCSIKQIHVLIQDTWPKCEISKIQDCGRAPFWKWFYRYNSAGNHPISAQFSVQPQVTLPRTVTWQSATILQIQHGRRTP